MSYARWSSGAGTRAQPRLLSMCCLLVSFPDPAALARSPAGPAGLSGSRAGAGAAGARQAGRASVLPRAGPEPGLALCSGSSPPASPAVPPQGCILPSTPQGCHSPEGHPPLPRGRPLPPFDQREHGGLEGFFFFLPLLVQGHPSPWEVKFSPAFFALGLEQTLQLSGGWGLGLGAVGVGEGGCEAPTAEGKR